MNGVEEIYVLCNRVRWHAAYLPEVYANNGNVGIGQDRQSLQGTTSDDDEGSFNVDTEDGKPLSWQTKSTLTQLDDQIAAFDQTLDLRDEACFESDSLEKSDIQTLTADDSILNLDDTSFDEDSLYHQNVSIYEILRKFGFLMNLQLLTHSTWLSIYGYLLS